MLRPGVLPRPSAVALAAVSSSRQDPLRLTIAMWSWVVCKDYVLASPSTVPWEAAMHAWPCVYACRLSSHFILSAPSLMG